MPARLQRLRQRSRSPSGAHGSAGCPLAIRRCACHSDPDAAQHFPSTRQRRRDHHHHQTRRYDRPPRCRAEASDCGFDTDASAAQCFIAARRRSDHDREPYPPTDNRSAKRRAPSHVAANGRLSDTNPDAPKFFAPPHRRRYASKTDPDNFAAGRPARYHVNSLASATYPDHLAAPIDIRSKITPQTQIEGGVSVSNSNFATDPGDIINPVGRSSDPERAPERPATVVRFSAVRPHEDAAVAASTVECAAEFSDVWRRLYPA